MGKNVTNCTVEICFLTACSTEGREGGGDWEREKERERDRFQRQGQAIFVILKLLHKLYLIIQGARPCSSFSFYQIMKSTGNLKFYLRDVVLLLSWGKQLQPSTWIWPGWSCVLSFNFLSKLGDKIRSMPPDAYRQST